MKEHIELLEDEAAEREHCAETVRMSWPRGTSWEKSCLESLLMRERAAVRAPLQAEIERLQQRCIALENGQDAAEDHLDAVEAKLSEAQAEVESWKRRALALEAETHAELTTKLANLREAAERLLEEQDAIYAAMKQGRVRNLVELGIRQETLRAATEAAK